VVLQITQRAAAMPEHEEIGDLAPLGR
jgi:hypothetical protein